MDMKVKVVIIGAGGHSKVIIDILKTNPLVELIGLVDKEANQQAISDLKVIGDDSVLPQLREQGICYAFVAIGNNKIRSELSSKVKQMGFQFINAISPFSYVSKSVVLGSGIAVMPGSIINAETRIEDQVIINTGSTIDHECLIGKSCHIGPGCHIAGNVSVGDGTFLGIGTKVIERISIGSWSMAGAGAVIVKNIPDFCLATGVPARIKKHGINGGSCF